MFSVINISDEEKNRRRLLTNFAVKLTLLAAGVELVLELFYYRFVLSPEQRVSGGELHLLIPGTTTALGLSTIMLGMNRTTVIPLYQTGRPSSLSNDLH